MIVHILFFRGDMDLIGLKYIIVGAGLWGSVLAERIATILGQKVVVIDKRDHIGGNSFSKINDETGIEFHCYGTHIFHTKIEKVWDYFNQFTDFTNYQHKVLTQYKNCIYSMPINLATINQYYGLNLHPFEVENFITRENSTSQVKNPANLEEKAISLIGAPLYEAFIKGYTQKQWEIDPKLLPADIITRLPVRYNYNANYFNDPYQGLPRNGYGNFFKKILSHPNISVHLNVDYFQIRNLIPADCKVIYTGPIDRLLDFKYGPLDWRSVRFEKEVVDVVDYQGTSVLNFADLEIPFTRVHEFKHLHLERNYLETNIYPKTLLFKEYSKKYSPHYDPDPYYPINDKANNEKHQLYLKEITNTLPAFLIGGRIGQYCYWDMDRAVENALDTFENIFKKKV
ncbi:MAG: UDP-galactopyranose mutase [Oligoflexia bacterium]|nr:UDP-galactopyranose mutase [Oligoflexia bacterium]